MWEEKIRKVIWHMPLARAYRLELTKELIDREFKKEIQELRDRKADKDEINSKENDRSFELQLIAEEQDFLFSEDLLKRARQLHVPHPDYPDWNNDEGYKVNPDWTVGLEGIRLSNH